MARTHAIGRNPLTIRDVAEAAGVSVSTVSNALNGRVTAMTPDTLERVERAIADLKYRRSSFARGLATQRSTTIGLLMAEIETPLFLQALHIIEPIARSRKYNLLLAVAADVEEERQALDFLRAKDADGFIFFSTSVFVREDHLLELALSELPVVLVNRSSRHPTFDQVNWDNRGGVAAAVDHLAGLGHTRIAHMKGPGHRASTIERLAGYKDGLTANGLPFNEAYVLLGDYSATQPEWEASARALLDLSPRPTAVIASDDALAAFCVRELHRAGLRVPDDMAVIGIDDQPYASYLRPALTTVRLPIPEASQLAIEMLLERLSGRRSEARHDMLSCPLIVRESSGALMPQSVRSL